MFKQVLVANRGEIAVRIIQACHDLGIRAVAAYSEADRESLAVHLADSAICIGPAAPAQSYLNPTAIISAALVTGCDAVHPGYGFLAENVTFADLCAEHNLIFVGPHSNAIRMMSNKVQGRQAMQEAGVPIVPGSVGPLQHVSEALALAEQIGYPVILKPSVGGGGRSLRVVSNEQELTSNYPTVRAEAEAAFGRGEVLMERYLADVRHIEVQVLADKYGNMIHLGERDCSAQRRHQKIVEEAPSPAIDAALRERLGAAALLGARAIGYDHVGTLEFLVDAAGNFAFIEMNTRIQVEHAVTEMITGIDLVTWQLLVASGEPLPFTQNDIVLNGHAIECRINAEDPERDFLPVSGRIEQFIPPGGPGVRVDTHIYAGYEPPRTYDTLLTRVLIWGRDRPEALNRMRRALAACVIRGVETTIPFQQSMLDDADFLAGTYTTRYVANMIKRRKNAA
jgi:acetyl-CoA carboxylase biotin carboxylase subunit